MDTPDRGDKERRKHVRFAMNETDSDLEVQPATADLPPVAACQLRNLSFSGMCFASQRDLDLQQVYSFRIRVRDLQEEPFAAKAEIRWKQSVLSKVFCMAPRFGRAAKGGSARRAEIPTYWSKRSTSVACMRSPR